MKAVLSGKDLPAFCVQAPRQTCQKMVAFIRTGSEMHRRTVIHKSRTTMVPSSLDNCQRAVTLPAGGKTACQTARSHRIRKDRHPTAKSDPMARSGCSRAPCRETSCGKCLTFSTAQIATTSHDKGHSPHVQACSQPRTRAPPAISRLSAKPPLHPSCP